MKEHVRTIRTLADLHRLRGEARRGGRRSTGEIEVEIPELSEVENADWEDRIERGYFACGCPEGAVVATLATAAFVAWVLVRPGGLGALSWVDAVRGAAVFVIAAGLGKGLGLALARTRLVRTLDELEHVVRARGAREPSDVAEPQRPAKKLCAVD